MQQERRNNNEVYFKGKHFKRNDVANISALT